MTFSIGAHTIGPGNPVFFIAEAGVNHNGSTELACQLIDAAAAANADAVKFQSFRAENIITRNAPKSTYHVQTTGSSEEETWYDMLKRQEMSREMHEELVEHCKRRNIIFSSTPYDLESLELLVELEADFIKIASTDTSNLPFLERVGASGLPVVLSSAMATMEEVSDAVATVRAAGNERVAVLQCTGNYPARVEDSNLNVMSTYRDTFGCPVGYSDHTHGITNPIAATALGANLYEKHFTLDRGLPGPDHRMSMEPEELVQTVTAIRETEAALGSFEKRVLKDEEENRMKLRKSVVALVDIAEGQIIEADMVAIKRPATGIPPKQLHNIIGKRAMKAIPADGPVFEGSVEV